MCVPYAYQDEDGVVRFEHVRHQYVEPRDGRAKTFTYRYWVDAGCGPDVALGGLPKMWRHLVFDLPTVLVGLQQCRTVYVAEGEKDALTLKGLGYVATSHHGAGDFDRSHASWFVHASRVVVVMDRDRPGARKAWRTYAALRAEGVLRVDVYRATGSSNDLSEFVAQGGDVSDLLPVPPAWLEAMGRGTSTRHYRRLGYGRR